MEDIITNGWPGRLGSFAVPVYLLMRREAIEGTAFISLCDISDKMGISRSNAHRAVTALIRHGWLSRDSSGVSKLESSSYSFPMETPAPEPPVATPAPIEENIEKTNEKEAPVSIQQSILPEVEVPEPEPQPKKSRFTYEQCDIDICTELERIVQDNYNANFKLAGNVETHYNICRLLRTRGTTEFQGPVEVSRIYRVLKFIEDNPFWPQNVRSAAKLREQFVRLEMDAKASGKYESIPMPRGVKDTFDKDALPKIVKTTNSGTGIEYVGKNDLGEDCVCRAWFDESGAFSFWKYGTHGDPQKYEDAPNAKAAKDAMAALSRDVVK